MHLANLLLPENLTDTHEYDKCVFIDDDGQAYMTFGNHKDRKINYYIVELNDDMISLKMNQKKLKYWAIIPKPKFPLTHLSFINIMGYTIFRGVALMPFQKMLKGHYTFIGQQDAEDTSVSSISTTKTLLITQLCAMICESDIAFVP
jgi:hypothetical protein